MTFSTLCLCLLWSLYYCRGHSKGFSPIETILPPYSICSDDRGRWYHDSNACKAEPSIAAQSCLYSHWLINWLSKNSSQWSWSGTHNSWLKYLQECSCRCWWWDIRVVGNEISTCSIYLCGILAYSMAFFWILITALRLNTCLSGRLIARREVLNFTWSGLRLCAGILDRYSCWGRWIINLLVHPQVVTSCNIPIPTS